MNLLYVSSADSTMSRSLLKGNHVFSNVFDIAFLVDVYPPWFLPSYVGFHINYAYNYLVVTHSSCCGYECDEVGNGCVYNIQRGVMSGWCIHCVMLVSCRESFVSSLSSLPFWRLSWMIDLFQSMSDTLNYPVSMTLRSVSFGRGIFRKAPSSCFTLTVLVYVGR